VFDLRLEYLQLVLVVEHVLQLGDPSPFIFNRQVFILFLHTFRCQTYQHHTVVVEYLFMTAKTFVFLRLLHLREIEIIGAHEKSSLLLLEVKQEFNQPWIAKVLAHLRLSV